MEKRKNREGGWFLPAAFFFLERPFCRSALTSIKKFYTIDQSQVLSQSPVEDRPDYTTERREFILKISRRSTSSQQRRQQQRQPREKILGAVAA